MCTTDPNQLGIYWGKDSNWIIPETELCQSQFPHGNYDEIMDSRAGDELPMMPAAVLQWECFFFILDSSRIKVKQGLCEEVIPFIRFWL